MDQKDLKKEVNLIKTLFKFLREANGRWTIYLSFLVIFLGKVCTVVFPLFFKKALDILDVSKGAGYKGAIFLLLGYGFFRILAFGLGDLRDILFTPLEQRIVRHISGEVFAHLHALPLSFHLDRKTGGMANAIDRGTRALESFFRFFIFNILPSGFEILLVCTLLWIWYPPIYGWAFLITILLYGGFTIWLSAHRLKQIEKANHSMQSSRTYSLDSLMNYPTVKYFNSEKEELKRFDAILKSYEETTVKVRHSCPQKPRKNLLGFLKKNFR
jgi:ATP-binding cassette subfamily B protein